MSEKLTVTVERDLDPLDCANVLDQIARRVEVDASDTFEIVPHVRDAAAVIRALVGRLAERELRYFTPVKIEKRPDDEAFPQPGVTIGPYVATWGACKGYGGSPEQACERLRQALTSSYGEAAAWKARAEKAEARVAELERELDIDPAPAPAREAQGGGGGRVISKPGAALEVREVELTEAQRKGLTTTARSIPSPTKAEPDQLPLTDEDVEDARAILGNLGADPLTNETVVASHVAMIKDAVRRERPTPSPLVGSVPEGLVERLRAQAADAPRMHREAATMAADALSSVRPNPLLCESGHVIGTGAEAYCVCPDSIVPCQCGGERPCPDCERRVEGAARVLCDAQAGEDGWFDNLMPDWRERWLNGARAVIAHLAGGAA